MQIHSIVITVSFDSIKLGGRLNITSFAKTTPIIVFFRVEVKRVQTHQQYRATANKSRRMNSTIQLSKDELRKSKPTREEYLSQPKLPVTLVLDNVTNSYNIGAFIRLADAFAIEKIIVCGALTISDKKLKKASRNEAKWVSIEYSDSTITSLQTLLKRDYSIFSVELCHTSIDYKEVRYSSPCALVLGNERKGVSDTALKLSHHQIHIPMFGMGNSLNVSTAGAIVLAEATSQMRKANLTAS